MEGGGGPREGSCCTGMRFLRGVLCFWGFFLSSFWCVYYFDFVILSFVPVACIWRFGRPSTGEVHVGNIRR